MLSLTSGTLGHFQSVIRRTVCLLNVDACLTSVNIDQSRRFQIFSCCPSLQIISSLIFFVGCHIEQARIGSLFCTSLLYIPNLQLSRSNNGISYPIPSMPSQKELRIGFFHAILTAALLHSKMWLLTLNFTKTP